MIKLKDATKEIYIIQFLKCGNYDFSNCKSREEAAAEDWDDSFANSTIEEKEDITLEKEGRELTEEEVEEAIQKAKEEHKNTFHEFSKTELIEAHQSGYGWPTALGFIVDEEEI